MVVVVVGGVVLDAVPRPWFHLRPCFPSEGEAASGRAVLGSGKGRAGLKTRQTAFIYRRFNSSRCGESSSIQLEGECFKVSGCRELFSTFPCRDVEIRKDDIQMHSVASGSSSTY